MNCDTSPTRAKEFCYGLEPKGVFGPMRPVEEMAFWVEGSEDFLVEDDDGWKTVSLVWEEYVEPVIKPVRRSAMKALERYINLGISTVDMLDNAVSWGEIDRAICIFVATATQMQQAGCEWADYFPAAIESALNRAHAYMADLPARQLMRSMARNLRYEKAQALAKAIQDEKAKREAYLVRLEQFKKGEKVLNE